MYCKYRCPSGSLPSTLSDTNTTTRCGQCTDIKGAVHEITPLLDVLVVRYMYTKTNRRRRHIPFMSSVASGAASIKHSLRKGNIMGALLPCEQFQVMK